MDLLASEAKLYLIKETDGDKSHHVKSRILSNQLYFSLPLTSVTTFANTLLLY